MRYMERVLIWKLGISDEEIYRSSEGKKNLKSGKFGVGRQRFETCTGANLRLSKKTKLSKTCLNYLGINKFRTFLTYPRPLTPAKNTPQGGVLLFNTLGNLKI
jgi:hypothetical protein